MLFFTISNANEENTGSARIGNVIMIRPWMVVTCAITLVTKLTQSARKIQRGARGNLTKKKVEKLSETEHTIGG